VATLKLAQQTQKSTQEIHNMIERLQNSATAAVTAISEGATQVQTNVAAASKVSDNLQSIKQAIAKINDMNSQIASVASQQVKHAEEFNATLLKASQAAEQAVQNITQTENTNKNIVEITKDLRRDLDEYISESESE